MDEVLVRLIKAFAPTVARKLIDIISERKVERDEVNILLVALLAEQNHNIVKSLNVMGRQMVRLAEGIDVVLKEIKLVNEGVAVLLKRTES